jgi:integrase
VRIGWCRNYINSCVGCVRRAFRWAVSEELVPPSVLVGLEAVAGLQKGRSTARETKRVGPVPDADVDATLLYLAPPVAAMVRLQRLSAARPGEVRIMRPHNVDRSGPVWEYRPETHKTEHQGIERVIFLGPQAQVVLTPFLLRDADTYCFSPRDAMADVRRRLRASRKSRVQPSQLDRSKPNPKKAATDRYTRQSYGQAIRRACKKANVPHWSPNQLRHSAGTQIRRAFKRDGEGADKARCVMGQRTLDAAEIYAERDQREAAEVMAKIG